MDGLPRTSFAAAMLLTMLVPFEAACAEDAEKEHVAIVELGGAGEWGVKHGGSSSYGPSLAVETTPIEHWLEIEAGVAPLFSRGQTEWDVDLLFKKPFTLSNSVEFMVGAGPTWSHVVSRGRHSDSVGAEAALDFMFWPTKSRKLGWYLEPSYGYSFAAGHEQSASISAELLIPIR
jgi:hypothetical protein